MPRIIFTHPVRDPALWASKHAERVAAFAGWGSNVVEYLAADGSNNIAVSVDVHDFEAMQASLASPELAAAKEAHGVLEPMAMHLEKQ